MVKEQREIKPINKLLNLPSNRYSRHILNLSAILYLLYLLDRKRDVKKKGLC